MSRLVSETDPLGFATTFSYDVLNQVTSIRGAGNGVTQFTYDANGNLLSVTDALAHTTSYAYDVMDRVATRTDPLGNGETFTYDLAGNLATHVDRQGQTATFSYDAVNRRTGAAYVDATVMYSYDAVSRLTGASDSAGGAITNVYDTLDRLVSQGQPVGTVSYTYDAAGRRATMTVPNQAAVAYTYDNTDRLTGVTQGTSAVQLAYDAAGRRTSLTLPNGVSTQYGYDNASELTSLTYLLNGTALGDLQYTYDAAGQRVMVGGSWARTGVPAAVASATYDAANRQLTFGGATLGYDLNGNLLNDGVNAYTWDARNRLATITGPASASFVYDAGGRRQAKTIDATTTSFVYDGLNPVQEQSGAAVANLLTGLGIDEFYVRADAGRPQTFLTDALGSTVALTDPTGAIQATYTYEPLGATALTGTTPNGYDYTGRESDGTALKYYRARYYHPGLERFISEDPVEFAGGDPNLYAYVWNRPSDFRDPFGEWGFGLTVGASAGIGLGAGVVGATSSGVGIFGGRGNGLNAGAFGSAGGLAGYGRSGPRFPDPIESRNDGTGYVTGYGASVGGGLFATNAKNVCDLKGPFKTFTVAGGLFLGGELTIAWSGRTYFISTSVTASALPMASGMVSLINTNTAVKPLGGRNCACK